MQDGSASGGSSDRWTGCSHARRAVSGALYGTNPDSAGRILDTPSGQEYNDHMIGSGGARAAENERERGAAMAIPFSRTIFGALPWYSVLIVAGILLAVWLAGREEKRLGLPRDTAIDLALVVVPCGIVGARLYYAAMKWELFASNPVSVLYIWEGGIAIYGAVIGGAIGAFVYARKKKLPFLRLTDIIAPGLLLAQAIGRWGNYFNMEAYGPEILNPQLQFFPLGVLIPQGEAYVWHMATFFYESVWNLAGFAALWRLRTRQREDGSVFFWYLLIYGSGRFIIEQLRQDSLYVGALRASQYLSLVLCAVSACVLLWRAARGERGRFWISLGCAALWLARWACLETPWLYGALALAALGGALWARARVGVKRTIGRIGPVALADALGLLLACAQWPVSAGFAMGLHTLLCSATLPCYVGALCARDKT